MRFNKVLTITKINIMQLRLTYIMTALIFLVICGDIIVQFGTNPGNRSVSAGNYMYLLTILVPIFTPAVNFKKFMHLNVKKAYYYWGILLNYLTFSVTVSILNLLIYYTADRYFKQRLTIWNLVEIFGWSNNGVMVAFLQQFSFLFLETVFIHVLTNVQTFRFGWAIDAILIAIIAIFTSIAPLRKVLGIFFKFITLNSNVFQQIAFCLIISAVIYALDYFVLLKKKM